MSKPSYVLDVLTDLHAHSRLFLQWPTVERPAREPRGGRRHHADVLWRLAMLEYWFRRNFGTHLDVTSGVAKVQKALQSY